MEELVNNNFLLFGSSVNNYSSNTPDSFSAAVSNPVFAANIQKKNLKKVVLVPKGMKATWNIGYKTGTKSGMFQSNPEFAYNQSDTNWWTWVSPENYIFIICQNVINGDSSNDVIRATEALTNVSGKMFTTPKDGIVACCIGKGPDDDNMNSHRKHISFLPVEDAFKDTTYSYTSANTRAASVCGAGNERRYGTCCLYYSSQHFDRIRGITYDAGDFYRCTCTECYRCSEMAESLGMQYRFNKWVSEDSGPTGGTGENCLHCDSEDFPSNCGPCECTIEWNERNYHYNTILNTNHFSPNTSEYQNAKIAKANAEQGGGVSSVIINRRQFTDTELTIPSSYRNDRLIAPLFADFDVEKTAQVELITEVDSNARIVLRGFKVNKPGSGATNILIDYDTLLSTYLPNVDKGKLQKYTQVNVIPLRGFHNSLNELYPNMRLLLDMQILKSSIGNITGAENINTVSIASGGLPDGGNMMQGAEKNEAVLVRCTTKMEIENPEAAAAPSSGSGSGGGKASATQSFSNKFDPKASEESVSIQGGNIVFSQSQTDVTKADIEMTGRFDQYEVGRVLTISGDDWTTNTKEVPTSPLSGDVVDTREIKVEHTHNIDGKLDISQGTVANSNSINVQFYIA